MPKINYITTPLEKFVTKQKGEGQKNFRTSIHCPLCLAPFSKREFEDHVYTKHVTRVDECMAKLFGVPFPARCECGRDLHYSRTFHGFPKSCGQCETGCVNGQTEYKNADDAAKHVAQLEAYLAHAKAEQKRLAKEAEFDRIPTAELPFPTRKDPRLLRRISKLMRTFAVNGDKEEMLKLANFIDKMVAEHA